MRKVRLLPSQLDQSLHDMSTTMFFPHPLPRGKTISEWSDVYLGSTRDEAKFIAFLSLYGTDGVLVRDLIAFTTLRASVKPSENHWLLSGEVGPILRPIDDADLPSRCSFLDTFARETSNYQGVDSLENRLFVSGSDPCQVSNGTLISQ